MQTLVQLLKMTGSTRLRNIVAGLAVLLFSLGVAPALAAITNINAFPAAANVPLGRSASVAITWGITTSGTFVSSPGGKFQNDSGVIFGTTSTSLYKTAISPDLGTVTSVTEVVLIPANVIYRAYSQGATNFFYSRTFTDSTGSPSTWSVTINITSSALSGFNLSGMSLSFDNGAVVRIIDLKHKLQAKADINFSGTGLLQGVWEVADPVSTASNPIYRPLMTVRQYLAGSGKQTLLSPALPTQMTGLYLVRLRITDPTPGFEPPLLRYFVRSGKPGELVPVVPIALRMPSPQTLLLPDTLFAWEPVDGARAYQIELYPHVMTEVDKLPNLGGETMSVPQTLPNTPPVAGILVAASKTRTVLPATAFSHLKPGQIYLWRVLAINKDGNIIGTSSIREIRLP